MKYLFFLTLFLFYSKIEAQVSWQSDYETSKKLALQHGKLILVDFWADWCGPCKALDRTVWPDPEIQLLQLKCINLKLDIDIYGRISRGLYNIEYIPQVMLIDAFGNVIHTIKGSLDYYSIKKILQETPVDVSKLYAELKRNEDNPLNPFSLVSLAEAYQTAAMQSGERPRSALIKISNNHYNQALKLNKDNSVLTEKINIALLLNKIIDNKANKVISKLTSKLEQNTIQEVNKAYAIYVLITALQIKEKDEDANKWIEQLKMAKGNSIYLKALHIAPNSHKTN